ncbi:MAG: hypothetical protein MJ070_07550 [Lachnospiraceae bacterium]|nr:hypothetical protein [Lachnospiraceae bacterium]
MRKLKIFTDHHMDLVWRRCFQRELRDGGKTVSSYGTLEEYQIRQMLDLAERDGVAFGIEQMLSVKSYLEKNPDDLPRFREQVRAGKIEILGCGMAALDTNMMNGETLLRNHVDGIRAREELFGVGQKWANLCDLFGFSGQLPQILSLCGYRGICQYSRVMEEQKPFYRGIDGSTLVLGNNETDTLRVHFGQYCETCPVCGGTGCEACDFTGIDWSFLGEPGVNEAEFRKGLESVRDTENETTFVMMWSEEGAFDPDHAENYRRIAAEYGFDAEFVIPGEYNRAVLDPLADRLEAGNYSPDDVEPEHEANPVATGCYTSRIELKKELREAEGWYYAAETLAALSEKPYPEKKLASLREKLYLCGFHDAVTGSHSDAANDELRDECRAVKRGAAQIVRSAIGAGESGGKDLFTVFNPTGGALVRQPVKYVFHSTAAPACPKVIGEDGNEIPVVGFTMKKQASGWAGEVTFLADIRAFGCAVFRLAGEGALTEEKPEFAITEKGIGSAIPLPCLTLSEDIGDPWGRQEPEKGNTVLPFAGSSFGNGTARLTGKTGETSYEIALSSYPGCDTVYGKVTVDWHENDRQLYLAFPLPFAGAKGTYGIPFGSIGRGACDGEKGHLGHNDLWPFYDWFAASDPSGENGLLFLARGMHGARIRDGMAEISLLRSVPLRADLHNHGGREAGQHVFEFAVVPVKGSLAAADPTGRGTLFCSLFPTRAGGVNGENRVLFDIGKTDASVAALFREGDRILCRLFDPYGNGASVDPERFASRTDVFGRDIGGGYTLKPFEIGTFLLK